MTQLQIGTGWIPAFSYLPGAQRSSRDNFTLLTETAGWDASDGRGPFTDVPASSHSGLRRALEPCCACDKTTLRIVRIIGEWPHHALSFGDLLHTYVCITNGGNWRNARWNHFLRKLSYPARAGSHLRWLEMFLMLSICKRLTRGVSQTLSH